MVTLMFWYGGGWAWWQAGLMWIAAIVFWGLLIWAVWALVSAATRRPGRPGGDEHPEGRARRILDERLARGDISTAEYRRLRAELDAASRRDDGDDESGGDTADTPARTGSTR